MVQNNARKTTGIRLKLFNFMDRHVDEIIVVVDHLLKFLTVLGYIWLVFVVALGLSNIFFFHRADLGMWQCFAALYWYWYRAEQRKVDKLKHEVHNHEHAVNRLIEVLQAMTGHSSANITITPIHHPEPSKKKDKMVN